MGKARRPWGTYEILTAAPGYKSKRITVLPGHRLSYQRHRQRREVWTVVSGSARVVLGDEAFTARVGDVVVIGVGQWHRIGCNGRKPLVFIEVQTGRYLGEDDIERRQDDYGRR